MNVLEFKKKLVKARDGIEQQTAKAILKFEKQIVDLVRENQIFRDGEDGSGNIIGVYKITVERPFDHSNTRGYPKVKGTQVNLFDRGSLYQSFTTDYGSFVLEVFPTDSKAGELIEKYGNDIFFMQTDNQRIVNFDMILPELQKFVKNTLR